VFHRVFRSVENLIGILHEIFGEKMCIDNV